MNMGRRTPIDAAVAQLDAALGACSGHGVCVTTLGGDAKCLCENGIEGCRYMGTDDLDRSSDRDLKGKDEE